MKTIGWWTCLGSGFALATILTLPVSTRADEHENGEAALQADAAPQAAQQQDQRPKLRIFELEYRSPAEIQQILALRTQPTTARRIGFRPPPTDQDLAIAMDPERNLLFVRGPQDQISKVEELVEAYDLPAEEIKKQQFDRLFLLPIDAEAEQRVQNILTQLRFTHQVARMGDIGLLVVRAEDPEDAKDQVSQIEEILGKLDTRETPAEQTPAEDAPAEEAPAGEAPAEEAPAAQAVPEPAPVRPELDPAPEPGV